MILPIIISFFSSGNIMPTTIKVQLFCLQQNTDQNGVTENKEKTTFLYCEWL
jgi:hypothetical protein